MDLIKELSKKREEFSRLEAELQDAAVLRDPKKLKEVGQAYSDLKAIIEVGDRYQTLKTTEDNAREMLNDPEMKEMAEAELHEAEAALPKVEQELLLALVPPDPLDKHDIIMEIRAGTGGDEAALFAAELFRLYTKYAEKQGWTYTVLSQNQNDLGGFKEVQVEIDGHNVYSHLKFESGVHRVQRIPETEKAGRVHTSTATVAVLPVIEETEFELDPKDLKIEATTSSGHGGQSVNTTYSAIRMTHLPTGITVQCQDERSQKQNKERAMSIMRSRVWEFQQEQKRKELSEQRLSQIGSGDRSEKIRTYNFPQDRLTDHRLNANFHNLPNIMDGNIEEMIAALKTAEREAAAV